MHCANPLCVDDECHGECETAQASAQEDNCCGGSDELYFVKTKEKQKQVE